MQHAGREASPPGGFVANRPAPVAAWAPTHRVRASSRVPTAGRSRAGLDALADFGPLAAFVADPCVTDVFANGPGELWVDSGSGPERQDHPRIAESELRELAVRLVAAGGRHVDEAAPCVDARLGDGIRVHAVLPPVSTRGTLLSIRLPRPERWTIEDLDRRGLFPPGMRARVERAVAARRNVLVTGAAGSGKTTLLSAMLASASPRERIVAIEDVAELRVAHPHFVALQVRQANIEGAGELGLSRLVREALRMRPDRLVLGECRGAEVGDLLMALNTGHDGGAATMHANSIDDVPSRLEALGALAGMTAETVARQAVSALDVAFHLERTDSGRSLVAAGRFVLDGPRLGIRPLQ